MADVLGELFTDIANSIRVGLGTLDEMAPTAFPGKIDKIVELLQNAGTGGGGSGGTEGSSLKIKSGNFHTDANGSRAEVAHGLGTMPDLVIVYIAGAYDPEELQNNSGRYLLYSWAIKDSFGTSSHGGYAIPGFHTANVSALNEKNAISVYCPNDDVFQFGNADTTANGRLMPDTNYYWMAFSGLGAAEPVLQNKTITENGTYTADAGFDGLGEVTVEVAGSGGSLPAGLYRRNVIAKPYTSSETCLFKFNNRLYCFSKESYSDTSYHIFLFDNGTWVKKVPNAMSGWSASTPGAVTAIEHNGKVHIVTEYTKDHRTWDGVSETLESVGVLHCVKRGLFLYNGELFAHSSSKKVFNKWNEDGSQTAYTMSSNIPTGCTPFEYNGELYFFDSTNLYKINLTGLTTTVVKSGLSSKSSLQYFVKGKYVYGFTNNKVIKFDMESLSDICEYNYNDASWAELVENEGILYGMGYSTSQKFLDEIHEVTE